MRSKNTPVRILIKCKDGVIRPYETGYAAIKKYRESGQLIGAWSTSTGKAF